MKSISGLGGFAALLTVSLATLCAAAQPRGHDGERCELAAPDSPGRGVRNAVALMREEGLWVSGEVAAPELTLTVSLPGAALPPMGFSNQFGSAEVGTLEDCARFELGPDCGSWVERQLERRALLSQWFTSRFSGTPAGLRLRSLRVPSGRASEPAPGPEWSASSSRIRFAPAGARWRFEARISLADLPPTAQHPLREFWVAVGTSGESTHCGLRTPIRWDSEPPLLERLTSMEDINGGTHQRFYQPGAPVARVGWFENTPVGYQYTPTEPSPSVREVELAPRHVLKFGAVDVYEAIDQAGRRAQWSFLGRRALDVVPIGDRTLLGPLLRGGDLHWLFAVTGTISRLGTGQCGACPEEHLWLTALDRRGRMPLLVDATLADPPPLLARTSDCKGVTTRLWPADQDGGFGRFGFTADCAQRLDDAGHGEQQTLARWWQWNAQLGAYESGGELPVEQPSH